MNESVEIPLPIRDPRVLFAAERTLLAWIRTSVAMMGFGFVIARFSLFVRTLARTNVDVPALHGVSPIVGTGIIVAGAIVMIIAAIQHVQFLRQYAAGKDIEPSAFSLSTVLAVFVSGAGFALAGYLLSV